MRQFIASLTIYSLLHLSLPAYATSDSDIERNFMKTVHELPAMAAGGLITNDGLDNIIARGREIAAGKRSLDEKARIINNIVIPLERVRQGKGKLDDCIAKKDPELTERTGQAFFMGAFSQMEFNSTCAECLAENPDWAGLQNWSNQILQISEEIINVDPFNYDADVELKNRLFNSERERILVPYLAIKASIEKEQLPVTPEEVLKKIGLATTKADTMLISDLPLMPVVGGPNPYAETIIDDNLRRTVQNMIDVSRQTNDRQKGQERQRFYDKTNTLIERYNEAHRRLNSDEGDRLREQIAEMTSRQQSYLHQIDSLGRGLMREWSDPERTAQMTQQLKSTQRMSENTQHSLDSLNRRLAQLEWNVQELEQQMEINPIINGAEMEKVGRGRDAITVRDQLFHNVENVTRERLTDDQMEKYLSAYYKASESLLKKLDEWNRDPDPATLIESTLYSNPAVAAEVLSENPEMAGRICHHLERAIKTKERNKKWDEILNWAKIVAAIAIIVASGGAILAGGVAIAAAIGFAGIGLTTLGVASGSYNLVRGLQLRSEYQQAKEHLIAMGYGDKEEIEQTLTLSKTRFISAALDYGLAASSGLAMINGIGTLSGGIPAITQATATHAGINNLISIGAKASLITTVGGLAGCKNVLMGGFDSDGDGVPDEYDDDSDDGNTSSEDCLDHYPGYTGPVNSDGCPLRYPIDRDCFPQGEDLTVTWNYDGSLDLINMFKLQWGHDGENFPDSEITVDNKTVSQFNTSSFGGSGDFYLTVSAIGLDMVESETAAPIIVRICN